MRAPYFLLVVLQSIAQVTCAVVAILLPRADVGLTVATSAVITIVLAAAAGTFYKRSL
jgi:hypothetical protein